MSIHYAEASTPSAEPIGTIRRGDYRAGHIDEARRIASRDPHRPLVNQTVRLPNTRVVVTIAGDPIITPLSGQSRRYAWLCQIRPSTPFEVVVHGQIEAIEESLRRSAQQGEEAA